MQYKIKFIGCHLIWPTSVVVNLGGVGPAGAFAGVRWAPGGRQFSYIHFWFVSFSEMVRSYSVYCFPTFQDELEELSSNSSEHK